MLIRTCKLILTEVTLSSIGCRMFGFNQDNLVSQALNCGLVKDLLGILSSRLDNVCNVCWLCGLEVQCTPNLLPMCICYGTVQVASKKFFTFYVLKSCIQYSL
jgi:hypothetical protein